MKSNILAVFTACLFLQSAIHAQNINIAALIQQAKDIAARTTSPADVITVGQDVMRRVPDSLIAYIPSAVINGTVAADIQDRARRQLGIELTAAEISDLQRGVIPVRIRTAIQARIPNMIQAIQAVELHLKNISTALYLLNNIIVPTAQQYLTKDLQMAVTQAMQFASSNEAAIQAIATSLLSYTGMLKNALNALPTLSDAQFKTKLVEVISNVQNQAIPLFNNVIKPFIVQNQAQLYNKLMMFKGITFSQADAQKVMSALQSLAQGM